MSAIEDATIGESAIGTEDPLGINVEPPAPSRRWEIRPAWYGIAALAVLTAYFTMSGSSYLFTFNLCMLAAIGAISVGVVGGTAGMVSVGTAAFLATGAFVGVFCQHVGMPFPLDILVGAVVAGVAGFLIGIPSIRIHGFGLFLASMAGHFLIVHFALEYQRSNPSTGAGFLLNPLYFSKGIEGGQVYWAWTLLVLVGLTILFYSRLVRERSGRAWRIMRDHEIVAHTLGVKVPRYKLLAFVISSTIIGAQGGLIAHFTGSVTAEGYTFPLAVGYVLMVVLGGLDSIAGAVLGAGIVTALPVIIPKVIGGIVGSEAAASKGPAYTTMVYGILIIVVVTGSNNGLIGSLHQLRGWALKRYHARAKVAASASD